MTYEETDEYPTLSDRASRVLSESEETEDYLSVPRLLAACLRHPDPVTPLAYGRYNSFVTTEINSGSNSARWPKIEAALLADEIVKQDGRFPKEIIMRELSDSAPGGIIDTNHIVETLVRIGNGKHYRPFTLPDFILGEFLIESLHWARDLLDGAPDDSGLKDEFHLWIDPGDAPPEVISEVLSALSDLNRAYGGNGLIFAKDESQQPIILCNA